MAVATLDTLAVVKRLKAAGFSDDQAEAVSGVVREAQDVDLSELATKADLAELKAATKTDLAELKAATKADLSEVKAEILKWMFGQTLLILGVVAALLRFGAHP